MSHRNILPAFVFAVLLTGFSSIRAQQVTVTTSTIGVSDSFYEHFNIGWGFRRSGPGGSMFFRFGGPNSAIPPFGGYNPNADFRFGMAQSWGNGGLNFGISAGSGSQRTITMDSASVTTLNGVPASVRSTSLRPFVVGIIPVVGDFPLVYYPELPFQSPSPPVLISPLAGRLERLRYAQQNPDTVPAAEPERADVGGTQPEGAGSSSSLSSTAQQGDISVLEIRRQQAGENAELQRELASLIDEARAAEKSGQKGIARLRYKQAAAKASGERRRELLDLAARVGAE